MTWQNNNANMKVLCSNSTDVLLVVSRNENRTKRDITEWHYIFSAEANINKKHLKECENLYHRKKYELDTMERTIQSK
jgi:hypothetical protein